jgi:predicted permease
MSNFRFAAGNWLESLLQDLRYAARTLRKNPAFTAVAIATLALGIGANSTIFTIVNSLLFESLPYDRPDQLVVLENVPTVIRTSPDAPSDVLNWTSRLHTFQSAAAYSVSFGLNLGGGERPEHVEVTHVSDGFFETLRVPMLTGEGFRTGHAPRKANPPVVLSYNLWRRDFGTDPKAIGRLITINGMPYTLGGVAARDFSFPAHTEVWAPLSSMTFGGSNSTVEYDDFPVIGRIADNGNLAQARLEMNSLSTEINKLAGKSHHPITVTPLAGFDALPIANPLWILFGAALLVLLVACANIANLNLSRMVGRHRELAVRLALGGGRFRLLRLLIVESLLVSLLGCGAGLLICLWSTPLIQKLSAGVLPRSEAIHPDLRVLAFAFALAIVAGIGSVLLPALRAIKIDPGASLKESAGSQSKSVRHTGMGQALVVLEVATALLLVVGSGLLIRSLSRVLQVDPGYRVDHILTASLMPFGPQYAGRNVIQEVLQRLAATPGIDAAGATSALPLQSERTGNKLRYSVDQKRSDDNDRNHPIFATVTCDYLHAMGIPLLQGREFTSSDEQTSVPATVIVSRAFAERYWPRESALGKHVSVGGEDSEIVGVVGNVHPSGLEQNNEAAAVYMNSGHGPLAALEFAIRSQLDSAELVTLLRKSVAEIDPTLPLYDIRTMEDRLSASFARRRLMLSLLGGMAIIALVLGVVGIAGVTGHTVASRTREIGIRIALGASSRNVLWMVFGQTARLTLLGIGLGLALAAGFTRILTSMLFGVSALDPATFISVSAVLGAVTSFAAYIPSRRSTRVDPVIALRQE